MVRCFEKGDMLRSLVNAHGLIAGKVYEVVDVLVRETPYGPFYSFLVRHVDGGDDIRVGNPHLFVRE